MKPLLEIKAECFEGKKGNSCITHCVRGGRLCFMFGCFTLYMNHSFPAFTLLLQILEKGESIHNFSTRILFVKIVGS